MPSKLMLAVETAYATLGTCQKRATDEAVLIEPGVLEMMFRARNGLGREKRFEVTVRMPKMRSVRVNRLKRTAAREAGLQHVQN